MTSIYVLHENAAWVEPLRTAFLELSLPHSEWFLDSGTVNLDGAAPKGVFYNRMSASSHTRGHRYGPELTHVALNWLESQGRRVVNSSRALYLEVSKVAQYAALGAAGVTTPRTRAASGRDSVLHTARDFGPGPYILKPNRGGKGLGVQLFQSIEAIEAYLDGAGAEEEAPIDGIWLLQDYIRAPQPFITRVEFVGGRFLYAVRVDTSEGFELCPADACKIEDTACPVGSAPANKFTIQESFETSREGQALIPRYESFLRNNGIEIAGIEFISDSDGTLFTYDVNTNTNYNPEAEAAAGVPLRGMQAVARFLGSELAKAGFHPEAVAAE